MENSFVEISKIPIPNIKHYPKEHNFSFNKFQLTKCFKTFPEALFLLTATAKQRFEFIFTDYGNNVKHFSAVFDVYKIYQASQLYRELKLRSNVLSEGKLNILPQEQIFKHLNGVYNLSSDTGNLGAFVITNVRLVWFADLNHSFNISLPYMQILSIKLRESKYGRHKLRAITVSERTNETAFLQLIRAFQSSWLSYRSIGSPARCS
jgi:Bardet-Biedl syndrome 5 protein